MIVTTAEVRTYLGLANRPDDDLDITLSIGSATRKIEELAGPVTPGDPVTVTLADGQAVLPEAPVMDVVVRDSAGSDIGATFDGPAGLLLTGLTGIRTVTYTPGRVSVPDNVKHALLVWIKGVWQMERGGSDQLTAPDGTNGIQPGMNALLFRVKAILGPDLRAPRIN